MAVAVGAKRYITRFDVDVVDLRNAFVLHEAVVNVILFFPRGVACDCGMIRTKDIERS